VNAVLDGQLMPIPLRTSVTSLKIALALQKSLMTGQKVTFDKAGNEFKQINASEMG
jgi:hypothetical protein